MDRDSRVAEHRLWPRRRDDNVLWFTGRRVQHGVPEMPKVYGDRFGEYFVVADRSLQIGIPIDQSFAAVDSSLGK